MFSIHPDDLTSEPTRRLLALHLAGMHANSPPGHVFALDLSGLQTPDVTVWSVRAGDDVVGIGALKELGDGSAEVKSMRTHPDHLRRGVAALLLDHIVREARARGLTRLSLETGSGPAFEPALALYRKRGFVNGEAFADYQASAFNQFLHLALRD
ncbi:GNAT family N-acetyltransferase [Bradyrhizobium symbiodeficiens]|uniref:GNAT family N-acetyltransferase n=1 Tax=Bradyrhizobium symbiodeficiens TaxID=1404367 RepID=A0A6G9A875_9BRAD|nr:GNAT family N-acetyltransferase [Bradyrhizobium symbiodeficiens]QIP08505.1 GNAT family N-acetyltransferase [Bradyrhizobium symbiodeficiens]